MTPETREKLESDWARLLPEFTIDGHVAVLELACLLANRGARSQDDPNWEDPELRAWINEKLALIENPCMTLHNPTTGQVLPLPVAPDERGGFRVA
jgi:hypothetical protein